MGYETSKKTHLFLIIGILSLVLTSTAFGLNIQVGGGQPLEFTSLAIVHQEAFDPAKAPEKIFWGVLDLKPNDKDPWTGRLSKGGYELSHTGAPGAVRYYFRQHLDEPAGATLSEQALSVEVSGRFDGDISAAGLLYAFNPETKHYFAFVKGKANSYAIYQRDQDGLHRINGGQAETIHPDQPNQLAIVPQGSEINFYINGSHIAKIKTEVPSTGGAGLIAISDGSFVFDNFILYNTPHAM